jgi:molybdopterin converting factor small subunit
MLWLWPGPCWSRRCNLKSRFGAGRADKWNAEGLEKVKPMAHVTLIGNLRQFTGGATELEVEASNVRQLFRRLSELYPELAPHLEKGLAVAIDGQIYQDALLEPIRGESEVHILPQIAGG